MPPKPQPEATRGETVPIGGDGRVSHKIAGALEVREARVRVSSGLDGIEASAESQKVLLAGTFRYGRGVGQGRRVSLS